ncbi:mannosyl-oligosaccharide 1,2-alpha-mannosidase IA-like [Paramacrobiotus metropolitanus]|uniref:mannosyl-oligosaccharide 1,2-alpha-mannosidase IA-like n=1 Tax=Paramacrobiotus metropolitanus TaxID=2943436 RepID=UPI0024458FEC|nr:mannosyl-oligosaccharide 1,2-alpha-mannosidase IA-like [Paramacrobiotus metropolitanus]XP_055334764.1 mannosyl-oligosaccharide 1,2-alpha-mannosidase IA-like [Paramacrobiotus metropolitanus]
MEVFRYFPPRKKLRYPIALILLSFGALLMIKVMSDRQILAFTDETTMTESGQRRQESLDAVDPRNVYRQNVVKQMMKFAWDNYVKYAWGDNELRPVSRTGFAGSAPFGDGKLGLTIIDSLDTLFLMGLTNEFDAATEWVTRQFKIRNAKSTFSVFEANIRLLGGFLSAHALSGRRVFLDKAIETADTLLLAFNTTSGLPWSLYDASIKFGFLYNWLSFDCVFLADVGTLHLEFAYLSEITGNIIYLEKVKKIRQLLKHARSTEGLYPNLVDFRHLNGSKCQNGLTASVGAFGDSFYEYLLKAWLWSSGEDTEAKEMFFGALTALEKNLLKRSRAGLAYFAKLEQSQLLTHNMEHLACFIGGLYALAAESSPEPQRMIGLAKEITKTCHLSYNLTQTGLGPESFRMDGIQGYPKATVTGNQQYSLRPEVVESYYYLWKVTGNEVYREWAWEAVLAMERHCKKEFGYSGVTDVDNEKPGSDDVQQSYFMAETLKYLYLIFVDDDPLPLSSWVFNTEAHPLPVIDSDPFRRAFYNSTGKQYRVLTSQMSKRNYSLLAEFANSNNYYLFSYGTQFAHSRSIIVGCVVLMFLFYSSFTSALHL